MSEAGIDGRDGTGSVGGTMGADRFFWVGAVFCAGGLALGFFIGAAGVGVLLVS